MRYALGMHDMALSVRVRLFDAGRSAFVTPSKTNRYLISL